MKSDEADTSDELRAPFPWFGGKRRVSEIVWDRFGDVPTYNEPFAGSLAVLLGRPHAPRVETVNDLDAYLANFWRALQHDPDGVAYHADGPVNEADLHARHRWLVDHRPEQVMSDPLFYDVQTAGWWVWGQCLWIGSGWCQTDGCSRKKPGSVRMEGQIHRRWQGGGKGGGSGVHAPTLSQQKPGLSGGNTTGKGVCAASLSQQVPLLRASASASASGQGVHATGRSEGLYDYLGHLAARLRRVRVCCGDWRCVLTPSVTTYIGVCGVFLDPPYSHELRERCYTEDHDISGDVRGWAIEHGDNPDFRIALCGYEGEHEMPASWDCVAWKAHGGYSRSARGVANREKERIWFSPHCLTPGIGPLFR